ncbi:hypothetical protein [Hansschlegelia sp.]|nr:hypothetical protein [Hansschlegelia sp.]HVI28828.1 hypothetical protein [Hansschlegelia sp.]
MIAIKLARDCGSARLALPAEALARLHVSARYAIPLTERRYGAWRAQAT